MNKTLLDEMTNDWRHRLAPLCRCRDDDGTHWYLMSIDPPWRRLKWWRPDDWVRRLVARSWARRWF